MESVGSLIGIVAIAVILVGILLVMQRRRTIEIPEGFATETDTMNPITKIIKKVGALSLHFADPALWKRTLDRSNLSFTDLARQQIAEDRRADKIAGGN